jgi:hypothetical protein
MSSCNHLQFKVLGIFSANRICICILALNRAYLGVWLAIDEVNPKLWAAAIAVVCGVLE